MPGKKRQNRIWEIIIIFVTDLKFQNAVFSMLCYTQKTVASGVNLGKR